MKENIVERAKYVLEKSAEIAADPNGDLENLPTMPHNVVPLLLEEIDRMRLPVAEQIELKLSEFSVRMGKGNVTAAMLILVDIIRLLSARNEVLATMINLPVLPVTNTEVQTPKTTRKRSTKGKTKPRKRKPNKDEIAKLVQPIIDDLNKNLVQPNE